MATTKSASVRETSLNINQPLIKTSKYKRKNHQLCFKDNQLLKRHNSSLCSVNLDWDVLQEIFMYDFSKYVSNVLEYVYTWSKGRTYGFKETKGKLILLEFTCHSSKPSKICHFTVNSQKMSLFGLSLSSPPPLSPKRRGARKEAGTCRCQTAYESWFFSSTIWVPETVLKSLPLMTSTFIHWAI